MKTLTLVILLSTLVISGTTNQPPELGQKAPDFTLETLRNKKINLKKLIEDKHVVLVILRGWPEYQCPICTRQVGKLINKADEFEKRDAIVLLVYPGKNDYLHKHANEFIKDNVFPNNFVFVLDPDYGMVNLYGLRWDEEKETAFPSTFVINKKGIVVFSKISKIHGGRPKIKNILKALDSI